MAFSRCHFYRVFVYNFARVVATKTVPRKRAVDKEIRVGNTMDVSSGFRRAIAAQNKRKGDRRFHTAIKIVGFEGKKTRPLVGREILIFRSFRLNSSWRASLTVCRHVVWPFLIFL